MDAKSFAVKGFEITALVKGEWIQGDIQTSIYSVNSLAKAEAGELTFLGNSKYLSELQDAKASIVFIEDRSIKVPKKVGVILVENASYAFDQVIALIADKTSTSPVWGIHPQAYLDEEVGVNKQKVSVAAKVSIGKGSQIGDGCIIGANVVIGKNVYLGKDSVIHPGVVIEDNCLLGDKVILQAGVVIGSEGFGYEFVDGVHRKLLHLGIVRIGNQVEVGANTTIDRARFGETVIGEGTKIDNLVQIAHNVKIGKHCLIVSGAAIAGSAKLGNYVTLAGKAGVVGHIEIADKVVISAQSLVTKTIEKAGIYLGNPCQPFREEMKQIARLKRLAKQSKDAR